MKRTPFLILLSVVFVVSTYYFIFLTPQARAHHVEREYAEAIKQLNQSPPGIPRAEEFIRRVRAIGAEQAPPEIQKDLQNYADTLNQAIQVAKAGHDTSTFDQECATEKAALVADFKRYDY